MTHRDTYPAGAPCWVDTLQADPEAAMRFYGALLGWSFDPAAAMPVGLEGEYFTARLAGRKVAGIGWATRGRHRQHRSCVLPVAGRRAARGRARRRIGRVGDDSPHTPDLAAAEAFYGALFGWELERAPGASFAEWRLRGELVAVVTATAGTTVPSHWSGPTDRSRSQSLQRAGRARIARPPGSQAVGAISR